MRFLLSILFLLIPSLILPCNGFSFTIEMYNSSKVSLSAPLPLANNSFIYPLFLNMTMQHAKTLPKGKLRILLAGNYLPGKYDNLKTDANVDVDINTYYFPLSLSYGFTHNAEIGLAIPYLNWDGQLLVGHEDISWFEQKDVRGGLSDVSINYRHYILEDTKILPDISLTIESKLPTGTKDQYRGSGGLDVGFFVNASKDIMSFTTHLDTGYIIIGNSSTLDEDVDLGNIFTYGFAIDYPISKGSYLILQTTGNTSPFPDTNLKEVDNGPLSTTLGYRFSIFDYLEIYLGGSIGLNDASLDYGAHLGLASRIKMN